MDISLIRNKVCAAGSELVNIGAQGIHWGINFGLNKCEDNDLLRLNAKIKIARLVLKNMLYYGSGVTTGYKFLMLLRAALGYSSPLSAAINIAFFLYLQESTKRSLVLDGTAPLFTREGFRQLFA